MKPADIYIPPKDRNTWRRFRGCINSFYEAVCDPCNTVQDNAELMMQNSELKLYVQNLESKIEDTKKIKERFEALEKSQAPEYEKILATTKKQLENARRDLMNQRSENVKQKKAIDLYK